MKKSLLYRNTPINYLFIVIVAFAAAAIRIYFAITQNGSLCDYSFLFGMVTIKAISPIVDSLIISTLFLALAVFTNFINNHFVIVENAFQRPAFMVICFSALIVYVPGLTPALLSLFLVLLAFSRVLPTFRQNYATINAFDAALLVSLASMFAYYAIFYFILIVITIIYLKPINIKEILALILGLMIPYLFFFFILYIFDLFPLFKNLFTESHFFAVSSIKYSVSNIIFTISSLILSIVAIVFHIAISRTKKIMLRRYHSVIIYFIIIAFLTMLIPIHTNGSAVFLIVPLSLALSQLLISTRYNVLIYFVWVLYLINVFVLLTHIFLNI